MRLLARLTAWLTSQPTGLDRQFPTQAPRGRVHFDGEKTTLELIRELQRTTNRLESERIERLVIEPLQKRKGTP